MEEVSPTSDVNEDEVRFLSSLGLNHAAPSIRRYLLGLASSGLVSHDVIAREVPRFRENDAEALAGHSVNFGRGFHTWLQEEGGCPHLTTLQSALLESGRPVRIGVYTLEQHISSGGMGDVFSAADETLQEPVALKIRRPTQRGSAARERVSLLDQSVDPMATDVDVRKEEERTSFFFEARLCKELEHDPRIVSIKASTTDNATGVDYIAMELLHRSLHDVVQEDGPLEQDDAFKHIVDVACGLQYAQESLGVKHGDIKPENLLLDKEGRVRICDFGLATSDDEKFQELVKNSTVGGKGVIVRLLDDARRKGTAKYIAPEIAAKQGALPNSDIYSLCVTWWYLVHGSLEGIDDAQGIPEKLGIKDAKQEKIFANMRSQNSDERYPSFAALVKDMQRKRPVLCASTPHSMQQETVKRSSGTAIAAAALAVVVSAYAILEYSRKSPEPNGGGNTGVNGGDGGSNIDENSHKYITLDQRPEKGWESRKHENISLHSYNGYISRISVDKQDGTGTWNLDNASSALQYQFVSADRKDVAYRWMINRSDLQYLTGHKLKDGPVLFLNAVTLGNHVILFVRNQMYNVYDLRSDKNAQIFYDPNLCWKYLQSHPEKLDVKLQLLDLHYVLEKKEMQNSYGSGPIVDSALDKKKALDDMMDDIRDLKRIFIDVSPPSKPPQMPKGPPVDPHPSVSPEEANSFSASFYLDNKGVVADIHSITFANEGTKSTIPSSQILRGYTFNKKVHAFLFKLPLPDSETASSIGGKEDEAQPTHELCYGFVSPTGKIIYRDAIHKLKAWSPDEGVVWVERDELNSAYIRDFFKKHFSSGVSSVLAYQPLTVLQQFRQDKLATSFSDTLNKKMSADTAILNNIAREP